MAFPDFEPTIPGTRDLDKTVALLRGASYSYGILPSTFNSLEIEPPPRYFGKGKLVSAYVFPYAHIYQIYFFILVFLLSSSTYFSIHKALFFHVVLREHGLLPTVQIFLCFHEMKALKGFYYFSLRYESPLYIYGKHRSVDKDWLKKYLRITPRNENQWNFPEMSFHTRAREVSTQDVSVISHEDLKVLCHINNKFPEKHSLMTPVIENQNLLIFWGLFPCQPIPEDLGKFLG